MNALARRGVAIVAVVLLTGFGAGVDAEVLREVGVAAVLAKPSPMRDLERAVAAARGNVASQALDMTSPGGH